MEEMDVLAIKSVSFETETRSTCEGMDESPSLKMNDTPVTSSLCPCSRQTPE